MGLHSIKPLFSTIKKVPTLQYVSDLHLDVKNKIPRIVDMCPDIVLCGDVGVPDNPNVVKFIDTMCKQFVRVFWVPGNHDYACSPVYSPSKVAKYRYMLMNMANKYDNMFILDKNFHTIRDGLKIVGTTLWSDPPKDDTMKWIEHGRIHNEELSWLKNQMNTHDKVVVATHYVPTFQLIEQKYRDYGVNNRWWFTDLDPMLRRPIVAWLCGHTHSKMTKTINGVQCCVNAIGYKTDVVEAECLFV